MGFKIKKKVRDPRTARKQDRFDVVSIQDDAVDIDATDNVRWRETLDPAAITLHEGQEPTIWTIRPLSRAEREECYIAGGGACDRHGCGELGAADLRARSLQAFLLGLVQVDGIPAGELELEELDPHIKREIGNYILALTRGQIDFSWREDLGKSSWRALQARRPTAPSTAQDSAAPSTAARATDDSSCSEGVARTPDDSDSPPVSSVAS